MHNYYLRSLRVLRKVGALLLIISLTCCRQNSDDGGSEGAAFSSLDGSVTGIDFNNRLAPDFDFNILEYDYFYNGAGVAAADFNNDGLTDLFFNGNQVPAKLYLNRGGLKFEDVTAAAGISTKNWATGVAVADVNNDGLADIYICYSGYLEPERRVRQLYINQGSTASNSPVFKEEAKAYGLDGTSYATNAAFVDYDRDGDLDLFVINHDRSKANPNYPKVKSKDGSAASCNQLFRNDVINGQNRFNDISKAAGIVEEGYSLGVAISDINMDGWPDIYVANDFIFDDHLYINNQKGGFTESLQHYLRHTSRFSMGCDIADFNNDGFPDILVADMLPEDNKRQKLMNMAGSNYLFNYSLSLGYAPQYSRNMLQLNNGGDGRGNYAFLEIGQLAGIFKTDWSWAPLFIDFDNDGRRDAFFTNGIPKDITNNDFVSYRSQVIQENTSYDEQKKALLEQVEKLPPADQHNFLFRNNGDLRFTDVSDGSGTDISNFSNGAVYADLDNDGDLDLVTNNINTTASVFRNNSEKTGKHYLRLKLTGRYASGAKVLLTTAGGKQYAENNSHRGFQSTVENIVHFGLGNEAVAERIEIKWLDGKQQTFTNIPADTMMVVAYSAADPEPRTADEKLQTVFKPDLKGGPQFEHKENSFEDFDHEPLLPHRLSRNGPYLATADVDGNGSTDLWIGGPAKIAGSIFLQDNAGKLIKKDMPDAGFEDMGGVFFDADGDNDADLYVVSGGVEYNPLSAPYQDRLYLNDGKGNFSRDKQALPIEYASGSCVAAADYDKDGDVDLFVGGGVLPTRYPTPAQSLLLINDGNGKFTNAVGDIANELSRLGIVTAALWSDTDNDGYDELLVTGEWMPLIIFRNTSGSLKRMSLPPAIAAATGWWKSIAAADFDNDGDNDYVMGNMGLNNRFKPGANAPLSVYAKDFNGNGKTDPVLTYFLDGKEYTIAGRDEIATRIPAIKKKFNTYEKFSAAAFPAIFSGDQLDDAIQYRATEFASVYIENKGGGQFEMRQLPVEAQFSVVRSILSQDFDGDGHTDLLVGGNDFNPDYSIGRYDASQGLLLRGNGKGEFFAVTAAESGLQLIGDTRAMIVMKIQGRNSVVVAANSGTAMTFTVTENKKKSVLK